MEAVQKDHWYFVVLIFLPFLEVAAQQRDAVTVRLEEGMVLECLCPWTGSLSMVSWTKTPDKDPVAVFHPEYGVSFSHHYRERVEFLRTTPMDGSISMRNVTHQDIGLYHCSVQTFPQGPWTRTIQVEDLDEPPEEEEDEDEEEDGAAAATGPPTSEPVSADRELVAERDNNLTIRCDHEHNGTVHQALLERRPRGQPWAVVGACRRADGGLVSEDYSEAGRVSCSDALDVTLHLTGVLQRDGGLYRCTFSTDAGVRTTTVLLTVTPPGGFSLSVYMMYIYIAAGAAGLILVTVIVTLAVRHRKKIRREEYRVKLHPSHRQPNHYENISAFPGRKATQINDCPVYANLRAAPPRGTKRQPRT